jgi:Domain of unknown function (DUF4190)
MCGVSHPLSTWSHPIASEVDLDFQPWMPKGLGSAFPNAGRSTSKLSIVSVVFGALGMSVLPLIGSIVAVISGHAALGQIRRSRERLVGKDFAILGLVLGYFSIVATLVVLVGMTIFLRNAIPAILNSAFSELELRVTAAETMSHEDFGLIADQGIYVEPDEILTWYKANRPSSDPKFAIITRESLICRKDGLTTELALRDVAELKFDESVAADAATFRIDFKSRQGPPMHIEIEPRWNGPFFYALLQLAVESSGAKLTPDSSP